MLKSRFATTQHPRASTCARFGVFGHLSLLLGTPSPSVVAVGGRRHRGRARYRRRAGSSGSPPRSRESSRSGGIRSRHLREPLKECARLSGRPRLHVWMQTWPLALREIAARPRASAPPHRAPGPGSVGFPSEITVWRRDRSCRSQLVAGLPQHLIERRALAEVCEIARPGAHRGAIERPTGCASRSNPPNATAPAS